MNRKGLLLIVGIVCVATISGVAVYADWKGNEENHAVKYSVALDNVDVNQKLSVMSVEDETYVSVRGICDLLQIEMNQNAEGKMEIKTENRQQETVDESKRLEVILNNTSLDQKLLKVIVDEASSEQWVTSVSINDSLYISLKDMCNILRLQMEQRTEDQIYISTNYGQVMQACYNNGDFEFQAVNLEITKETAQVIADDVFMQIYGQEYLATTTISIDETDDGTYYKVARYVEPVAPGNGKLEVIIRKSEGKIMQVLPSE